MEIGNPQEIRNQELRVYAAENAVVVAKLRLRALKGEPLLQELTALQNEFGSNLRIM